jgi:plastocyanin
MKARMITAIIAVIVSTLAVAIMSSSFLLNYKAEAQRTFVTRVLIGGGNDTYPFYGYDPQRVEIKAGSTVVWSVPSMAPLEPHTVSFLFSNKTFAIPTAPFAIPSSTNFVPLPHEANSKPNILPGKMELV